MSEVDYNDVVEGTIDEVKERVEDENLDPQRVRAAEKANKDRVTLIDWLDEQIVETGEADDPGQDDAVTAGGSLGAEIITGVTSQRFIAGLIIGVVLALAAAAPGAAPAASPAAMADSIETYFAQNTEGVPLESVQVRQTRQLDGSDLYQVDMVLSARFLNRTVQQNLTGYTTSDTRYIFLRTRPIDTERPLAEQLRGAQRRQPQQQ
ncbi:MAG: hypothetical protein SVW02_02075 [Candidatus Nanohaloarchaea archaeon]|nr:hypothetical protein [Candidatus Nanohaloarchaea archaeon]